MKNIKKQEKHGVCAIYCLANLFQEECILSYADDDKYIPAGEYELSEILELEGIDGSVRSIIEMPTAFNAIPADFFNTTVAEWIKSFEKDIKFISDEHFVPFFIVCQTGDIEETLHCCLLIYKNRKYYYSDPLEEEFDELNSLEDIHCKFKYVCQVWMVSDLDSGARCSIYNNVFDHD